MACHPVPPSLPRYCLSAVFASVLLTSGEFLLSGRHSVCLADEPSAEVRLSSDALAKYKKLRRGLSDLDDFLQAVGFERPAILETNYFALSVGGIDAMRDLVEGRGVDPETLGALYAGYAVPDVARELNMAPDENGRWKITSPDGRLRYRGTVIRLYSPSRLRKLFERREQFRDENERRRRQYISEYVYARRRDAGQLDLNTDGNEVDELFNQITDMQPLLAELDTALRAERTVSSIMQGEGTYNYFGLSIGGIDAVDDLQTRHAVDPETLAAIYAQRISPEHAGMIKVSDDGVVMYEDVPVRMYSVQKLEDCYKTRNLLVLQAGNR
ncbi:MAG: hypothetical protein R3C59_25910 [Planctomycetaceae bacterium]